MCVDPRDEFDIAGLLDSLDSLRQQHECLLSDMLGENGYIVPAAESDLHILSDAELNAFANGLDFSCTQEPDADDVLSAYLAPPERKTPQPGTLPSFPPVSIFDVPESPKMKKARPKKPGNRALRVVSSVVFYGFLLVMIAGAFLISQGNKNPVFGYTFANVLTWSMQSEIPQGSLVIIKNVDKNALRIGDDITYMKDSETSVTHRIIGITENYQGSGARGFETQGIENESADFDIVPAVNVVGKVVFHVPGLGSWLSWLRENLMIAIGFAVGLILLVFLIKGAFKKSPEEQSPRHSRQLLIA